MKIIKHYATLSDAIRADHRPQAFGSCVDNSDRFFKIFKIAKTCALAGAYEALTGKLEPDIEVISDGLAEIYPYSESDDLKFFACPLEFCRGCGGVDLQDIIMHLNDGHLWPKSAIADYVEKYEEKIGYIHLVEVEVNAEAQISEDLGENSNRDSVVFETAGYVSSIT